MNSKYFIFLFIYLVTSCIQTETLIKRSYVFNDNYKRLMILTFQNDSSCLIRNIYKYNEKEIHNELDLKCKYKILLDHRVLLINDNSFKDTTGNGFFFFPNSEKQRNLRSKNKMIFGPNYSAENERYLKVPYVNNDTLTIIRKKLIWIKKDLNNKVVGYYEFRVK